MKKINQVMGKPVLTTGQIGSYLGFSLQAKFIEDVLGIPPDQKTSTASYWFEERMPKICYSLSQHAFNVGFDVINEAG